MVYGLERTIDTVARLSKREGKLEMAKAMIEDKLSWETAAKYAGISVEELKKDLDKSEISDALT